MIPPIFDMQVQDVLNQDEWFLSPAHSWIQTNPKFLLKSMDDLGVGGGEHSFYSERKYFWPPKHIFLFLDPFIAGVPHRNFDHIIGTFSFLCLEHFSNVMPKQKQGGATLISRPTSLV